MLPSWPQVTSRCSIASGVSPTTTDTRRTSSVRCRSVSLSEQVAVDRDDPRRAVGDQRAALVVDDQAALRLHDDVAHRLVGGLRLVVVAADDLEVVEPHEERREEREDEGLDHHQAQAAALRAVDRAHQAVARCGSSRPKSFISGGSTNGVSSTSQTHGDHDDLEQLGAPTRRRRAAAR